MLYGELCQVEYERLSVYPVHMLPELHQTNVGIVPPVGSRYVLLEKTLLEPGAYVTPAEDESLTAPATNPLPDIDVVLSWTLSPVIEPDPESCPPIPFVASTT